MGNEFGGADHSIMDQWFKMGAVVPKVHVKLVLNVPASTSVEQTCY